MQKNWAKEGRALKEAGGKALTRKIDSILATERDDWAWDHIATIFDQFDEADRRKYAAILVDHLPPRCLKGCVLFFVTNQVFHPSYLHSLCILGYGNLGGMVIFDQLRHGKHALPHLEDYLSYLDADQIQEFLSVAVTFLDKSPTEIRGNLREMDCFPNSYLDVENIHQGIISSYTFQTLLGTITDFKQTFQ